MTPEQLAARWLADVRKARAEAAEAEAAALRARLARMEGALTFYADESTYETQYERLPCDCCTDIYEPINRDKGSIARAALTDGGSNGRTPV